jgi:hypothetical protein
MFARAGRSWAKCISSPLVLSLSKHIGVRFTVLRRAQDERGRSGDTQYFVGLG